MPIQVQTYYHPRDLAIMTLDAVSIVQCKLHFKKHTLTWDTKRLFSVIAVSDVQAKWYTYNIYNVQKNNSKVL